MRTLKNILKPLALGFFIGMGITSVYTFKNKPINYICSGTAVAGTCAVILASKPKRNYHTRIYRAIPKDDNLNERSRDILN